MTCACRRMDCVTCNRFRVMSCWRKRAYLDPAVAIRIASGDSTLTAYKCQFSLSDQAPHYHVGHVRPAASDEPEKLPRRRTKAKA